MEPEDKSEKDESGVAKQILEYYQKYSQNKELPKFFSGTSMSYMPPIVSDDVEEEIAEIVVEETNTETLRPENVEEKGEEPRISPASSVNSGRKLEWDNGADIGYSNCQKTLYKSQSLPILTPTSGENKPITSQVVTLIPYSSSEDSSNNKSDPVSSSTPFSSKKEEPVSSITSSSTQQQPSGSSSSNLSSFIKRKIGSPNAESTPKITQNANKINILKMVRLCQTKPVVVDCLDQVKEVYDKNIQTSTENISKSIQTSPSPLHNQSVIQLNYDTEDVAASRCDSFEYFHPNSSESSKEIPILAQLIEKKQSGKLSADIDKSVEILEKLLKSKKYDSETKKRYVQKIVKKIVDGKYSGDSTSTSSELFQPKKSQLQANLPWRPAPRFSRFTVKTFSNEFLPHSSSGDTDKTTSGSWKEEETLSERIYKKNMGAGGDNLIKFADQERQQQLAWIKNEITHLTKLQGMLEQNRLDPSRKTTNVYMISMKSSTQEPPSEASGRNYIIETELPPEDASRVVNDIQVESDEKTTNIKVKGRRANRDSSTERCTDVWSAESHSRGSNLHETARKPTLVGEGTYECVPRNSRHPRCCSPSSQPNRQSYNIRHYQFQVPLESTRLRDKVDEVLGRLKQPIERVCGEAAQCTINCRKSKKNAMKKCPENRVCLPECECKGPEPISYFKSKKTCPDDKPCVRDCECKKPSPEPEDFCRTTKKICPIDKPCVVDCECKKRKPQKKVCLECEDLTQKQSDEIDYFNLYTLGDLALNQVEPVESVARGVQCCPDCNCKDKITETDINCRLIKRNKPTCNRNLQCTASGYCMCKDESTGHSVNVKDCHVQYCPKGVCKKLQVHTKCQARGVPSQEFGQLDRFVDVSKTAKPCAICECIGSDEARCQTAGDRTTKEQLVGTFDYDELSLKEKSVHSYADRKHQETSVQERELHLRREKSTHACASTRALGSQCEARMKAQQSTSTTRYAGVEKGTTPKHGSLRRREVGTTSKIDFNTQVRSFAEAGTQDHAEYAAQGTITESHAAARSISRSVQGCTETRDQQIVTEAYASVSSSTRTSPDTAVQEGISASTRSQEMNTVDYGTMGRTEAYVDAKASARSAQGYADARVQARIVHETFEKKEAIPLGIDSDTWVVRNPPEKREIKQKESKEHKSEIQKKHGKAIKDKAMKPEIKTKGSKGSSAASHNVEPTQTLQRPAGPTKSISVSSHNMEHTQTDGMRRGDRRMSNTQTDNLQKQRYIQTDPKSLKDAGIAPTSSLIKEASLASQTTYRQSTSSGAGSLTTDTTSASQTAQGQRTLSSGTGDLRDQQASTSQTDERRTVSSGSGSLRERERRSIASETSPEIQGRRATQDSGTETLKQPEMCDCCGCKEIMSRVTNEIDPDSKKVCLCRDFLNQMAEMRRYQSSSSSSSDSDSSTSSYRTCTCCKRKNIKQRELNDLGRKLSDQSYPLCSPCYKQQRRGCYTQNYYQNPGHVCRCYSVVQTSTLNQVKQTIYDLNMIQQDCSCSDTGSCRSKRCKKRRDGKNGVAYMLTFEDGSIREEPEDEVKRYNHLEEIKIKIPVYKKKHKDKENKKKKKKKKHGNKSYQRTVQDYLNMNRPNFIQMADGRRRTVQDARTNREKMADYNKMMFLQNLCQDTKCEYTQKRLYSAKEMKEITRRNYWKLPEVQKKLVDNREKKLREASRLMADVFNKKLRENVLRGKLTIPTDQNVVTI